MKGEILWAGGASIVVEDLAMMRICALLCMFSGIVCAQRYGAPPRGEVFERAQMDLARAGEHSYDRRRIAKAQHEIAEFQRKLSYGRFSGRDLDRAIGATNDVVRRGSIPPVDRDILYRDVEGMRAFRQYAR
jgi:hypothetical protein